MLYLPSSAVNKMNCRTSMSELPDFDWREYSMLTVKMAKTRYRCPPTAHRTLLYERGGVCDEEFGVAYVGIYEERRI